MKKVLIIGADGMIGGHLFDRLRYGSWVVEGTTRRADQTSIKKRYFDLCDETRMDNFVYDGYSAVVLCAGVTSIESCEKDPITTREINVDAPLNIASQFLSAGTHFIYLSTNMVFDGTRPLVPANAPVSPKTEYGRQKVEVEQSLLALGGKISIVRLSKVIGARVPLLDKWRTALTEGVVINPYDNKKMAPISADFVIEIIRKAIDHQVTGKIQLSASYDISYAAAARYIAERLGFDPKLVKPISYTSDLAEALPQSTSLACDVLRRWGVPQPTPFDAIEQYLRSIIKT